MRIRAVAILMDGANRAGAKPTRFDLATRFTLAWVALQRDRKSREFALQYWRAMTEPPWPKLAEGPMSYVRATYARSCVYGLMHVFGLPQTPEFHAEIREMANLARQSEAGRSEPSRE